MKLNFGSNADPTIKHISASRTLVLDTYRRFAPTRLQNLVPQSLVLLDAASAGGLIPFVKLGSWDLFLAGLAFCNNPSLAYFSTRRFLHLVGSQLSNCIGMTL